MLSELSSCFCFGRDGFDVLELAFVDAFEDVLCPFFDEVHEGAVAEGAVGAAVGEVVGLTSQRVSII